MPAEAIEVMRELEIDISAQTSKTADRYRDQPFDVVITVCDAAAESCPVFPGAHRTGTVTSESRLISSAGPMGCTQPANR